MGLLVEMEQTVDALKTYLVARADKGRNSATPVPDVEVPRREETRALVAVFNLVGSTRHGTAPHS